MQLLSQANLRGLDPLQTNAARHTPDDAFYITRDRYRRPAPWGDEEAAWRTLMDSARRQNGLPIKCEDVTEADDEEERLTHDEGIQGGSMESEEDIDEDDSNEESETEEQDEAYADALEEIEP